MSKMNVVVLSCCLFEISSSAQSKNVNHPILNSVAGAAADVLKNAAEIRLARVPQDGQIEIAFAPYPQRSAERLIIKLIDTAQTSTMLAGYEFSSKPIADALCRAALRGVAVSAVLDAKANPHGSGPSKRDYVSSCGVAVKADSRYPIMHDKFIVVDGRHTETGSFNYSFSAAERNAENAIVVWNNPALADRFTHEFERLFNEAQE